MASGEPIDFQAKQKGIKGLMKQIEGNEGPKNGFFQSKLLSKKQDFSCRGTIYAAPDVGFNEAKIPKDQLWEMYKMHIIRDLSQKGYDLADAKKAYEDRNDAAMASFNHMVDTVPVLLNRAPTLMRTNIMAMKPIPSDGKTIGLNILHLPGYAADYDGDALSMYLPMTPEAVKEAREKLMPSNHLHDARRGFGTPMFAPGHEAILGSVHLTKPDMEKKVHEFKTEEEALKAFHAGEIDANTPIKIG
jgi:DNA-directed RNA polymerase subunit beta'